MKSKPILLVLLLLFIWQHRAQSPYDIEIEKIAKEIAVKISKSEKTKIAVWDFVDTQGKVTKLGKFIAEDFSVHFTNASQSTFQVMDRNHLNQILEEHKLNAEGFIDANTAKELGRLIAVDAIITGTVDVLGQNIKMRIKVLDTETALQIAAEMTYLPMDENIAYYLGVPNYGDNENKVITSSNEKYNYQTNLDTDCEKMNYGDFCFTNKTNSKISINLGVAYKGQSNGFMVNKAYLTDEIKDMTLDPGETQCFYERKSQPYKYFVFSNGKIIKNGNIKVEKCKTKEVSIR